MKTLYGLAFAGIACVATGCSGSQADFSLTALQLFKEYAADIHVADEKYSGKWLKVSGDVYMVESNPGILRGPHVEFLNRSVGGVSCVFDHKKDVKDFKQRSVATIVGKCEGVVRDHGCDIVVLRQCVCVSNGP